MAIDPVPAQQYPSQPEKDIRLLRAFAQIVLSEINVLRQEVSDLKARVALIDSGDSSPLNPRTIDQLKSQMKILVDAM